MSDSVGDAPFISEIQANTIDNWINAACTVVYCYEWLITIDQEFQHIWFRRWSLSTWIFVMNRYATLLDCILDMLPAPNALSCAIYIRLDCVLSLLVLLAAALFTGIRAYALCNRNIWVLIIVFTLSMVPFATNMVSFVAVTPVFSVSPFFGNTCEEWVYQSDEEYTGLSLSGRAPLIVSDLIVLFATWKRAAGTVRRAARSNVRVPLSEALLRDGTLFFLGLLAVNTSMILRVTVLPTSWVEPISNITMPLNSIMLSRFMLSLRQVNLDSNLSQTPSEHSNGATHGQRSTIRFNSDIIVGNMGESLRVGNEGDYDDEDDPNCTFEISESIEQCPECNNIEHSLESDIAQPQFPDGHIVES